VKKRFHQDHGQGESDRSGQPKAWTSLLEDQHDAGKKRMLTMGRSGTMSSFLSPDFPEARRCFRRLLGSMQLLCSLASFAVAAALYLLHLLLAFSREVGRQGKHDFYAGTSHLLLLPGFSQLRGNPRSELMVHLWVEPFLALTTAAMLRAFFTEHRLSTWLVLVAVAMWLKEFINFWYGIRSEKKHEDIIEDAKEKMPGSGAAEVPLPAAGTRKPRAKRPPQRAEDEQAVKALEFRSAEVLRLMPPHSLEQAELNYRHLIKTVHPDPNNADEGATEKAATLNEAIEYFRRTLGG
jgi:hypothetical protein